MRPALPALLAATALAACAGDDPDDLPADPVTAPDHAETDEDTPVEVDVVANDTDPSGARLRLVRASVEGHAVEVLDGRLRFTPARDFHGDVTIAYVVGANTRTARGTATITVRPVDDPPVANDADVVLVRNTTAAIVLTGRDVDGDPVGFELVDRPAHGTLTGEGARWTYAPATDHVGEDQLRFRATSNGLASTPAAVRLRVVGGAAPVADAQRVTVAEDASTTFTVTGSDPDGDRLTFAIATPPAHGTLTGTPPTLTYTPAPDYAGPDLVRIVASDGINTSAAAEVAITVTPTQDPPVATAIAITTAEDTGTAVALTGRDPDGDPLTVTIVAGPAHGQLSSPGANGYYTPARDYVGPDEIRFTVSDGHTTSAPATASLTVLARNDRPVIAGRTVTLLEDQATPITVTASDVDGDPLTYTVTAPTRGTVSGTGPAFVYTPPREYAGTDSFQVTVSDGLLTATATVSLSITAVNDPPTPTTPPFTVAEDRTYTFTMRATDPDSTYVSYTMGAAQHGRLEYWGSDQVRYTPAPDYHGPDVVTFEARDNQSTVVASVAVTVTPVNDAPIAVVDLDQGAPGEARTIAVLANDVDIDGDELALAAVATPAHGTAELAGDTIVYTPAAGFSGTDTVTYTIDDGHGGTATATVYVGVGEFPRGVTILPVGAINGAPDEGSARIHDLSADGRFLAFSSSVDGLVAGDDNRRADVFVRDRVTGVIERVSVSSTGEPGNAGSIAPAISADGRYVAFASAASNLVPGDSNARYDVFVHDRLQRTTTRVSVATGGAQATGDSVRPSISDDGRMIAFDSLAFDLVADDGNGLRDVFVHDRQAGTTTRVSVSLTGGDADEISLTAAVSGDGRTVAFTSRASNLVANDRNGTDDVFVRDLTAGATERVSVSSTGLESTGQSSNPVLSSDGQVIAFETTATDLVPGASQPTKKVVVRDRARQTTTLGLQGSEDSAVLLPDLSSDGRYLAMTTTAGFLQVRDRLSGRINAIRGVGGFAPVLSRDGHYVALLGGPTLGPVPTATAQVYVTTTRF